MRRTLLTLATACVVLYGAVMLIGEIRPRLPIPYTIVPEGDEPSGLAVLAVMLALVWMVERITTAVHDVRAVVHGWRVRRRADPIADYRIGHQPVRPDAVANQAA